MPGETNVRRNYFQSESSRKHGGKATGHYFAVLSLAFSFMLRALSRVAVVPLVAGLAGHCAAALHTIPLCHNCDISCCRGQMLPPPTWSRHPPRGACFCFGVRQVVEVSIVRGSLDLRQIKVGVFVGHQLSLVSSHFSRRPWTMILLTSVALSFTVVSLPRRGFVRSVVVAVSAACYVGIPSLVAMIYNLAPAQ